MAGRGLFNKLVDTFNAVADDARRQVAPKDDPAKAGTAPLPPTDAERAATQMESGRQVASEHGRQVASDGGRAAVADDARSVTADNAVECRFCKTPNQAGVACVSCGAAPDR